jgi:hypothetical protein
MEATVLHWLDAHAGAITALATLTLVAITAAYAAVTYLLVKEQRNQQQTPDVARFWAESPETPSADLRLHNIGDGAAAEVMVVRGPGDCLDVALPDLGRTKALLPGEEFIWRIRPPEGEQQFPIGDLSLTLTWFDNPRRRAYFDVFLLRVTPHEDGVAVHDLGSASKFWTARELRKMSRKSLPRRRRLGFCWRSRKLNLSMLLLDDQVRRALKARLRKASQELIVWSGQAEPFREQI